MSMPPVAPVGLQRHKQTCSLCARRKVKCDKGDPCSNCMKAKVQCLYEAAAPRLRKRPVDEDLLKRISLYEALLQKHGIDIAQSSNTSNSSNLDVNQDVQQQDTRILPSRLSESGVSTSRAYPPKANAIRCLWSDLSSEVCSTQALSTAQVAVFTALSWSRLCSPQLSLLLMNAYPTIRDYSHSYSRSVSLLLKTTLTATRRSSFCYSLLRSLLLTTTHPIAQKSKLT